MTYLDEDFATARETVLEVNEILGILLLDTDAHSIVKTRLTTTKPFPTAPLKFPTGKDLSNLENAIFEHGSPYKEKYLFILSETYDNDYDDLTGYLSKLQIRSLKSLRHCWDSLNWRPSENNMSVTEVEETIN